MGTAMFLGAYKENTSWLIGRKPKGSITGCSKKERDRYDFFVSRGLGKWI
jgi:hypothetical protein